MFLDSLKEVKQMFKKFKEYDAKLGKLAQNVVNIFMLKYPKIDAFNVFNLKRNRLRNWRRSITTTYKNARLRKTFGIMSLDTTRLKLKERLLS